MTQLTKEEIAGLIKEGRIAKGYTQQELADLARISLRSVQRIENGEVLPRLYTIRVLAEHLNISVERSPGAVRPSSTNHPASANHPGNPDNPAPPPPSKKPKLNKARKWILTTTAAILLLLLTAAFLSQSPRFPETDFERFLLWGLVAGIYSAILFRIWK